MATTKAIAGRGAPTRSIRAEKSATDPKNYYTKANFDACYNLYSQSLKLTQAIDTCAKKAKIFNFINNHNFDTCYKLLHKDAEEIDSVCKKKTGVRDPFCSDGLKKLDGYHYKEKSKYLAAHKAADMCIKKTKKFDFTNSSFDTCYRLCIKDKTSMGATDACIQRVNAGIFNFRK